MSAPSRNYGIDVLRILSMLFVVVLHVLGHGGILKSELSFAKFSLVWFLEILAYPAVNCFVLISGYVGCREHPFYPRLRNFLSLFFTVLFYSVAITALFRIFAPEHLEAKAMVRSFLPIITEQYWFFTAYFGLFLLSPFLNMLVCTSARRDAVLFFTVFALFSMISAYEDIFSLGKGYSLIWFILLYLAGGFIKKYRFEELFSGRRWLLFAFAALLITWSVKVCPWLSAIPFLKNHMGRIVAYTSPTVVVMAVGLLCAFSRARGFAALAAPITFLSTSAFSVYLIHDHALVRSFVISHLHEFTAGFTAPRLLLFILAAVAAIFTCCILIDKVRICLFRFLGVHRLSAWIEKALTSAIPESFVV